MRRSSVSTTDGVTTSAVQTGLGAPFRATGTDGITGGFTSSGTIAAGIKVGSSSDTVTMGMVSSARLLAAVSSADSVAVSMAATSLWNGRVTASDGVTVGAVASRAWKTLCNTADVVTAVSYTHLTLPTIYSV